MSEMSHNRLPKGRVVGLIFLVTLWLAFAGWQRNEYVHQSALIRGSLLSQAESLSYAVASGLQSHRWFSPFVQQQLPDTLGVLVRSKSVIAIGLLVDENSDEVYSAGEQSRIDFSLPVGEHAFEDVFQVVRVFKVSNNPPQMHEYAESETSVDAHSFKSIIVLDRSGTIEQINYEARNRVLVFGLGTLLMIAVGAVWWFTIRLAHTSGTTRLLRAETRHLRELGLAAAGLAHETRNPLGLIRGWTQSLVKAGLQSEGQKEQAEAILEECDRVTARINQFLSFARQADVQLQPVGIEDIVREMEGLTQYDLDSRSLKLEQYHRDGAPSILADRDQLRQLLFNLLQNAIAFSPEESTITIATLRSQSGKFRLAVADQGPGAAPEIADTIFEPYVSKRPGGTGLGLSIVRRIAVAHGWEVGYEAGEQGGSVFWVEGLQSVS